MALFGNSKCDCGKNKVTCDLSCLNSDADGFEAVEREYGKHDLNVALIKSLNKKIKSLEKKIWQLEQADHVCDSCGNVTKPSHYADGC